MSDGGVDLVGEFACRSDDQGNGTRFWSGYGDLLEEFQKRQNVGQRLSGSGFGVDDNVAPAHNQRNPLHLNRLRCLQRNYLSHQHTVIPIDTIFLRTGVCKPMLVNFRIGPTISSPSIVILFCIRMSLISFSERFGIALTSV